MSINVFLSEKLPENKDKIISILSFYKNIHCLNNVLSIGTPVLSDKNLYEIIIVFLVISVLSFMITGVSSFFATERFLNLKTDEVN